MFKYMNQNSMAAMVIFGSLVLLTLPMLGVAVLWQHIGRNEPTIANYLVVLAPIGWLIWTVCKNRKLDKTDSKILRACSTLNTVLIFVFILGFMVYAFRSCDYGLSHTIFS